MITPDKFNKIIDGINNKKLLKENIGNPPQGKSQAGKSQAVVVNPETVNLTPSQIYSQAVWRVKGDPENATDLVVGFCLKNGIDRTRMVKAINFGVKYMSEL